MREVARLSGLRRDDTGQLSVLIIGLVAVLGLVITVVVDASKVFLAHRSLFAAADGAAIAAAGGVDEPAAYGPGLGLGDTVPLGSADVRNLVTRYVAEAELGSRFDGLRVVEASTDGTTARVTLAAVVPLPLINLVSGRYADGYPIQVTANARSPLTE